jgi:NAD(P)-dependent dehydrogenase (short-subunit alcohol dehydrogenase family)
MKRVPGIRGLMLSLLVVLCSDYLTPATSLIFSVSGFFSCTLLRASSGIGRETAVRFARKGAKVVASARGEEGLDSLVQEIRDEGGEAITVPADTSEFEQVKAVADRAVQEYGRLDTWGHLAAVGLFATFEQTTPQEFARVIDVNLMGQVYGAMAALPHIKREGRGALIHISSVEAKRSFPQRLRGLQARHRRLPGGAAR